MVMDDVLLIFGSYFWCKTLFDFCNFANSCRSSLTKRFFYACLYFRSRVLSIFCKCTFCTPSLSCGQEEKNIPTLLGTEYHYTKWNLSKDIKIEIFQSQSCEILRWSEYQNCRKSFLLWKNGTTWGKIPTGSKVSLIFAITDFSDLWIVVLALILYCDILYPKGLGHFSPPDYNSS